MCHNFVATNDGRLGTGNDVALQSHPLDTVPGDTLAVIGNTNFHSVKASHCVYKGRLRWKPVCSSFVYTTGCAVLHTGLSALWLGLVHLPD